MNIEELYRKYGKSKKASNTVLTVRVSQKRQLEMVRSLLETQHSADVDLSSRLERDTGSSLARARLINAKMNYRV